MAKRKHVQNNLLALRKARGMTQRDLAILVGRDAATVSRWENREQGIGDHEKGQLAALLYVSKAQLMCWERIDWRALRVIAEAEPEPGAEPQDIVA